MILPAGLSHPRPLAPLPPPPVSAALLPAVGADLRPRPAGPAERVRRPHARGHGRLLLHTGGKDGGRAGRASGRGGARREGGEEGEEGEARMGGEEPQNECTATVPMLCRRRCNPGLACTIWVLWSKPPLPPRPPHPCSCAGWCSCTPTASATATSSPRTAWCSGPTCSSRCAGGGGALGRGLCCARVCAVYAVL